MPQRKKSLSKKLSTKTINVQNENPHYDEAVVELIRGLNFLIAKANEKQLAVAANILYRAKEDLVFWAVDLQFEESARDKFIFQHLFNDSLVFLGFLAKYVSINDANQKENFIASLEAIGKEYVAMMEG